MTPEVDILRDTLADVLEFDFLLAGINTTTTQPIGDYGRGRIRSLWREVTEVTGQTFGAELPADPFIYNSSRACVAVHAMRRHLHQAPFEYLHALQNAFFRDRADLGDPEVLVALAVAYGMPPDAMRAALDDPGVHDTVKREFDGACRYGTLALPNVLIDRGDGLRLLAGGYADAETLRMQLEAVTSRAI